MACGATWQECHYGVKMVYQRQPAQSGDVAFDIAAAINGKEVVCTAKAGSGGRLFGAVTANQVADAIEKTFGYKIEKKKISLKSEIKNFGTYEADVKLYAGISAKVTVQVQEAE